MWLISMYAIKAFYIVPSNNIVIYVDNRKHVVYDIPILSGLLKSKETDFVGFITSFHISRYVNLIFMFFMSKKKFRKFCSFRLSIFIIYKKTTILISFDGEKNIFKKKIHSLIKHVL